MKKINHSLKKQSTWPHLLTVVVG